MTDFPFADTRLAPANYLGRIGTIFATFDFRTQDSGNASYGVESVGRRWFVKTAGDPEDPRPHLTHPERVALLHNAQRLSESLAHPALPRLHGTIRSAWGPMLAYDWVEGQLVRAPPEQRGDPRTAYQRFRHLPVAEITAAIDTIIDVHVQLCAKGWIAYDFYDGSLIYDFAAHRVCLFDLDLYRFGPFTNEMGRMFGSSRFMAPEEFEKGARIDERTNVFTLGRALSNFLGDGTLDRGKFRGTESQYRAMVTACEQDRARRFQSVAELAAVWREA
jgi:serine/threonine-protein kinase